MNIAHKLLANYLFRTDYSEKSPILIDILMHKNRLEILLRCTNTENPVVNTVVLLRQNKIKLKNRIAKCIEILQCNSYRAEFRGISDSKLS